MYSESVWKLAHRPNYSANEDKGYPYSEIPYLGEYHLIKIPKYDDQIQHVDYWGEGRVEFQGTSGFANCYNVNHQYKLVSKGRDRDRKIPNRIPVASYDDCDTSAYIRDNSVITVTVSGEHINSSCAKDIARMVNSTRGRVIAYGFDNVTHDLQYLATELDKIGLHAFPNAPLPSDLQVVTSYKSHVSFLNSHSLKDELYNKITSGNYDNVENITKILNNVMGGEVISDLVLRLIITSPRNVMSFAYKLWQNGAKDIVRDHFPTAFRLIFNDDVVLFVNKQYRMGLKLDLSKDSINDRLAWGDKNLTSHRVSWKLKPVWDGNKVTFKLYNIDSNTYLKLDATPDNIGDRQAWGSPNSNEVRHQYYLEPLYKDGDLVFYIINYQYNQGLKLAVSEDSIGDRLLFGHNGSVYNESDRFRWQIVAY